MRQPVLAKAAINGTTVQTGAFRVLKGKGGNISLHLITDGTVAGAWKVLGSNKPDVDVSGDTEAVDITAAFKDAGNNAIATVTGSADATQKQGVQAGPIWFGTITVQFTPSGGAGNTSGYLNEAGES